MSDEPETKSAAADSAAASAAPPLAETDVPRLPRGVRLREDSVRGTTVLLGPERTVGLDPVAAAILGTMDGERTIGTIADHLADRYTAPRETILGDVMRFLAEMRDRGLLDIRRG